MSTFDVATAVRQVDDGTFEHEIIDGWSVFGNANGGVQLATVARALSMATGRPHPLSTTVHFLGPGRPGAHRIRVDVTRESRRFSTASFRMDAVTQQGESPVLCGVGTLGDFAELDTTPVTGCVAAPEMPLPDECASIGPSDPMPPELFEHIEVRIHPDDVPAMWGSKPGTAQLRGWFRPGAGVPLDVFAAVAATDVFPPVAFAAGYPMGWAPTLELTSHCRGVPQPSGGWLCCRFSAQVLQRSMLETDSIVWDGEGRAVAQSRQLLLAPC